MSHVNSSHSLPAEPDSRMDEKYIFLEALAIDSAEQREAFVLQACGEDRALRQRIDELLASSEQDIAPLERPLFETGLEQAGEELDLGFLEPSDSAECLGTIGEYECVEVLGHGAAGIVLKARDPLLNRFVAVKVMPPQLATSAVARQRFLREARSAAAVSHPHIITIHAVSEWNGFPFLVMECIQGESLQVKIDREGTVSPESIVRIGLQVAEGLAAAHESGLIHRDIKPSNILLENGIERVKITDFGLAMAVDDSSLTYPGLICGTPQFMSPEQARDEPLDQRSDLFSLGCVLYAMCTGRSPFRASSTIATVRRVCDAEPRPIPQCNRDVPGSLIRIIDRLLAKSPEKRFQSARELAESLRCELLTMTRSPTATAPAESTGHQGIEEPARSRMTVRTKAMLMAVFVVSATAFMVYRGQIEPPDLSSQDLTGPVRNPLSDNPAAPEEGSIPDASAVKPAGIPETDQRIVPAQVMTKPFAFSIGQQWSAPQQVRFDLPDELESVSADSPFLTSDELTMYFSSRLASIYGDEDIVMSTRPSIDAPWSRPVNLGSAVNTQSTERGPTLSHDGLSLLFSREHFGIDLWIAQRESIDSPWSEVRRLPEAINTDKQELEPFLSADSLTILFCRGGFGDDGSGFRIMQSNRLTPDSPWSDAVALSPTVNSAIWQGGAHLSQDGLCLLFHSSNGGIFFSQRETSQGQWSTPVQVVESPAAQPWLSSDGQRLYYRIHRADLNRQELWMVSRSAESTVTD